MLAFIGPYGQSVLGHYLTVIQLAFFKANL